MSTWRDRNAAAMQHGYTQTDRDDISDFNRCFVGEAVRSAGLYERVYPDGWLDMLQYPELVRLGGEAATVVIDFNDPIAADRLLDDVEEEVRLIKRSGW